MPDPLTWLDDALADLDRRGLHRRLVERAGPQRGDKIEIAGRPLINFGSNDYLGLASDPAILAAARFAIEKEGFGSGASPLVTGRSSLHAELERKLAEFEGTEAALLFPTGYAANVGAITALVGRSDAIYSDELNHASIIDGCRLSGATLHIFPNSAAGAGDANCEQLEKDLALGSQFRRRLIVTDSLFSMHGTVAALPRLAQLAGQYDAMLMVDEAHATGVFGDHGSGLCEESGVEDGVPIRVGTLSKALGAHGGFVAGSQRLIDWLANRARPYVFSTAAPPAIAAAAIAALGIFEREPERRQKVLHLAEHLRTLLIQENLIQPTSLSQIVPVILGEPARAVAVAAALRQQGFFVPAIRPPSVPENQSLLRISLTSRHTESHVNDLVTALKNALHCPPAPSL
jgi:8-amino-7-oxononanoate synthase